MVNVIEVEDRSIEYMIEGQGETTVVIIPGMGCSIYSWINVVKDIAKSARVIVFHRAGVGNSTAHIKGSSTEVACETLVALLSKLNIKDNIVLVGHSYGGLCVQHFARLYPEKVKGIVLVDSSSTETYKFEELELPVASLKQSDEVYLKQWEKYSNYTKQQLQEETKPCLSEEEQSFPEDLQEKILEFMCEPNLYKNVICETMDLRNAVRNIKNIGKFPRVPLRILIRDYDYSVDEAISMEGIPREEAEKMEGLWRSLSYELKNLSPESEVIMAKNCGHAIHHDNKDLVVSKIKELIK